MPRLLAWATSQRVGADMLLTPRERSLFTWDLNASAEKSSRVWAASTLARFHRAMQGYLGVTSAGSLPDRLYRLAIKI